VIAAEVEAARRDSAVGRAGADDVERELGRVANVLDMLHAKTSRYAVELSYLSSAGREISIILT